MKWPPRALQLIGNCIYCRFCPTGCILSQGEDADHVGAEANLLVQPFLPIVAPGVRPDLAGKNVNARMLSRQLSLSRTMGRVRAHALPVAPWSLLFRVRRQGLNCKWSRFRSTADMS
jgi:hypothetical protein